MKINNVYVGNNIEVLKTFPDNSIDSVVTDPPYGLGKEPNAIEVLQSWITTGYHEVKGKGFMGKEWDAFVPQPNFWKEIYRVLKPGGYVLSFAGTRTYDWMVMAIRLAGFEVRDMIAWLYGSGFPKSMDVSKAIDKIANIDMVPKIGKWLKEKRIEKGYDRKFVAEQLNITESAIYNWEENPIKYGFPSKKNWDKLKKLYRLDETYDNFTKSAERNIIGYKKVMGKNDEIIYGKYKGGIQNITEPSTEEAKQWEGWGTALKPALEPIVMARKPLEGTVAQNVLKYGVGGINIDGCRVETNGEKVDIHHTKGASMFNEGNYKNVDRFDSQQGRFPANVIHDGSDEVESLFPLENEESPSRFFYVAKASQEERNFGLSGFKDKVSEHNSGGIGRKTSVEKRIDISGTNAPKMKNIHPTVKPIELMRYLVRMVTPKNGICLDPYLGSGTTAIACKMENINYIGIELMPEYAEIAKARIGAVKDFDPTLDTKTIIKESIKEDKEEELGIQTIFDFIEE